MSDINCRLAKLEQRLETLEEREEKIMEALTDIRDTLTKQRSFIGGVVFTAGALFSVITWMFKIKILGA